MRAECEGGGEAEFMTNKGNGRKWVVCVRVK